MSAQLEIQFDPGPWTGERYARAWPVGGRIGGRVHVTTGEFVKARGLRLELGWRTEGRGNTDKQRVLKSVIHEGDLPEGGDWQLPFEVAVPADGPITYDGHYIRIIWEVSAIVDVPWARDTVQRESVLILPAYDEA